MGIFDQKKQTVTIETRSDFGKKLFEARIKSGKSQDEVGKKLERSRTAVANWELGNSLPDLPTFVAWCKLMKTTPNDILGF